MSGFPLPCLSPASQSGLRWSIEARGTGFPVWRWMRPANAFQGEGDGTHQPSHNPQEEATP